MIVHPIAEEELCLLEEAGRIVELPLLLGAAVELRGGPGHGEVVLDPLRGHLDHVHQLHEALGRGAAVVGDLAENLDGAEQIALDNVGVAPVVNQVDLDQHHGELDDGGGPVVHAGRQILVVLEQVDQVAADERVDGVNVPLDVGVAEPSA